MQSWIVQSSILWAGPKPG